MIKRAAPFPPTPPPRPPGGGTTETATAPPKARRCFLPRSFFAAFRPIAPAPRTCLPLFCPPGRTAETGLSWRQLPTTGLRGTNLTAALRRHADHALKWISAAKFAQSHS